LQESGDRQAKEKQQVFFEKLSSTWTYAFCVHRV